MKFKKSISFLLVFVMLLSMSATAAYAQNTASFQNITDRSVIPVINIAGDADPLYSKDGKKLLDLSDMSDPDNATSNESDSDSVMESVANVLYPFLVEGLLTNNWDNYYASLQKEVGEILGDALLDPNGNVTNGSDIAQSRRNENEYNRTHNKSSGGYYFYNTYHFWYDWRRDPIEIADEFHAYIQDVKAVTKKDKVAIIGKCLGVNVVFAYIQKYGLDDIQGIAIDGGVVNGAESMSEIISGKFVLDGNAITRFMIDCNAFGLEIDDLITYTIDLLTKAQVFDTVAGITKATIYNRIIHGVTSALALSTTFTWPSYWAGVTTEDYETAKEYVFGEEGSDKRTEYAGLIAKLDNYDRVVRQNVDDILKKIVDTDGVNLCIISKYGMQMLPCIESRNNIGDQFASVTRSSFGATTSSIYDTLSDEYIQSVTASGNERYIAPDKQVDASTCLYPDYTWFVKGASHTNWTRGENALLLTVATANTQLTVNDFEISQFMVYDSENDQMLKMTKDNCDCYNWSASYEDDNPTFFQKIILYFKSLFTWLKEVFNRLNSES